MDELELIEMLRVEGWLVTVKAMPDGFPFLAGNDADAKIDRRYVCELMWMPHHDLENVRKQIHIHPFGAAETMLAAIEMAANRRK